MVGALRKYGAFVHRGPMVFVVDDVIILTFLAERLVTYVGKQLVTAAIDHHTLNVFKDKYEQMKDKRRRPGPTLRKVIDLLERGDVSAARAVMKEAGKELVDCGVSDLAEAGRTILETL